MRVEVTEWTRSLGDGRGYLLLDIREGPIHAELGLSVDGQDVSRLLKSMKIVKDAYKALQKRDLPNEQCDCVRPLEELKAEVVK